MFGGVGRLFFGEVVDVDLDVFVPGLREVFLGVDGLDGALIDAEAAVDAGIGVDVELIVLFEVGLVTGGVDAVDGAYLDAGDVLCADAGFADDMGHIGWPFGIDRGVRV